MHILAAILVVFFWGINAPISKIGISTFPVFMFMSIRFFLTFLVFLPFSKKINKKDFYYLFVISILFNVFCVGFFFLGVEQLSVSAASSILKIQTPLAIILSCILFREKLNYIQMVGIIISMVGIFIVYGIPEVKFLGFVFIMLSAVSFAISQAVMRKAGDFDLASFVSYTSLFSVPFLIVLSIVFDKKLVLEDVSVGKFSIAMFYQVFILGVSTAVWQKLTNKYGVNRIVPFNLLSIVFSISGGMILLGEKLTQQMLFGALVIILGVSIVVFFKPDDNIKTKINKEKV